jgi:hypothetical protein
MRGQVHVPGRFTSRGAAPIPIWWAIGLVWRVLGSKNPLPLPGIETGFIAFPVRSLAP